jgi:hypothetical protein
VASFSRQSFGLVMWLVPATAMAAPFCVQTQAISPQCIFFDAASCNKRAKELGGTCTVDTSQITVSSGVGHYCLLTSSMVSYCVYSDSEQCNREALHQQGVCIQAPHRPESPGADPYREVRPPMAGG